MGSPVVVAADTSLVFYISSHGLGHITREIALIDAVAARRPGARIIVRSHAPAWVLESAECPRIELQPVETDTGVVQIDSLRLDEEETARRAAAFYGSFDARVAEEAAVLQRLGAALVIGDIPPLAFAAAARAGVPSVAVANFTWDWIYSIYPAFVRAAPDVIDTIRRAYADATHTLRLPLHGGFDGMRDVTDIPFIARRSRLDRAEARRTLGLDSQKPVVIASFGGSGLTLPYEDIARSDRFTLLVSGRNGLNGLRYEDLVAAADVVVSKPGYGIVSECLANGTALLYTSRGRFIEQEVLIEQMPRMLRCRSLPQEDVLAGRWADGIDAVLRQPAPPERPRVDGAEVAAAAIVNWMR
jgi:L-arabinokinase